MYAEKLMEVLHRNNMFQYEETNMAFIISQIIELGYDKFELVIRSDKINEMTYWTIRYFKAKNITPYCILSTEENNAKSIMNIPVVSVSNLKFNDSHTKYILVILNRESDNNEQKIVNDYRESDLGFCFRRRIRFDYVRKRGCDNYYFIEQNEEKYYQILSLLEDEESKESFIEVIRCLIENDIYRYKEYSSKYKYFDSNIYIHYNNECWLNLGTCTGDTILHYLSFPFSFDKIYAIEIEKKWLEHLNELMNLLPIAIRSKIEIMPILLEGANSINNIDTIFDNTTISLINMDIEGAEITVLEGAKETIRKQLPVLAIAAYHQPKDLYKIPELIKSISDKYHIFLENIGAIHLKR